MRRILCIWLPNWPLQRLIVARPELKRRAVALYQQRRGLKIVACSRRALQRGVVPGMPVAEASGVHLEEYQPAADHAALEELAGWCEFFSPIVGLDDAEPPESLLLDITALAPLLGDEPSHAEQVARAFSRRGYFVRLAIADTIGAAWAAAHHANPLWIVPMNETITALSGLPVETLRLAATTVQELSELGIHQIGQMLALPRSTLTSRFAAELVQRLNQATGIASEQIAAFRAVPEIVVERLLEYPVDRRDTIDVIVSQLIDQATTALAKREQGAIRLECQLNCDEAEPLRFHVGLFQASAHPRHLRELVQTRLERLTLPGPVVAVRLSVVLAARLQSRQRDLFGDEHDQRRQLALLVDRLSSRLEPESVVRSVPVADAQPEYAYRYEPLAGSKPPRTKNSPGLRHRPIFVEPRPMPLEVLSVVPEGPPIQFRWQGADQRVLRSWGPERIQTGWWRGNYIRRDYYRVTTTEGNRFWIFRRHGDWFLHGVFD